MRIAGVQRSEERQKKSTEEMNGRLKEKEDKRREQAERQKQGLECAREMANANCDHPHDESPDLDWYYGPGYFVDDVKGGVLDKQSCIDARRLEMQFFKKMGVYRKMPRKDLPPGAKTITTKWVDTNKGTEREPNYR